MEEVLFWRKSHNQGLQMSNKIKVKHIPSKTKYLVQGYIREIEYILDNSSNIADDIKCICLLYCDDLEIEEFNTKEKDIKMNFRIEKNTVTKKHNLSSNYYGGSSMNVLSLIKKVKQGKHIWKFKCKKLRDPKDKYATIGVQKSPSRAGFGLRSDGYLTTSFNNRWNTNKFMYGLKFNSGDMIQMTLNFKTHTLGFMINGNTNKSKDDAFTVTGGIECTAAIRMQSVGDSFEFISYQQSE